MSDVVPLVKPILKSDRWRRTLPGVPIDDPSWIIAVLEDLSAFAEQYCSCDIQNELNATTRTVRRLILTDTTLA